jgi:hypothetical protein
MAAAILVPAALVASAGLSRLLHSERESRIRSVQETGRATALRSTARSPSAEALAARHRQLRSLRRGDFAQLHREASAMNRATPWSWTLLIRLRRQRRCSTPFPGARTCPVRRAVGRPRLYDAQKMRVSGYFVGTLARRPTDLGRRAGAARARRPLCGQPDLRRQHYFARVFKDKAIGRDWVITIFDANGISIARNRNALDWSARPVRPELYQASRRQPNGVLRHTTHDGIDVYSVYTRAR